MMIGLLDCNNFFVSCERLFRPDLEGKPVLVLSSNDGCVVARSQEVKDLGITMGVPYFQVADICKNNNITIFSGNLTFYRDISARVMKTLEDEVGEIEIYSVDEAFFILPDSVTSEDLKKIRNVIKKNVGIPVSVGAAASKTLAKQASSFGKQGSGAYLLSKEKWQKQAKDVPCSSVWGLGTQTVSKLNTLGVKTASDFLKLSISDIRRHFGISVERVYQELHGNSIFGLTTSKCTYQKSIMSTASFADTTTDILALEAELAQHVTEIAQKLRERKLLCSAIQVQIETSRYGDFFMQGESSIITLSQPTSSTQLLLKRVLEEVRRIYKKGIPYKKAGVTVFDVFPEVYKTDSLFLTNKFESGTNTLDMVTDKINGKFGRGTVQTAIGLKRECKAKSKQCSPSYTTSWKDIPSVSA